MDFSVLSSDFRSQLEQQRDRLASERDAIVQAAIEQATATIDANLAHINALLGYSTNAAQAEPKAIQPSTKTKQKKAIVEPEIEPKAPRKQRTLKSASAPQEETAVKTAAPIAKKEKKGKSAKASVSKASKATKVKPEAAEANFTPPVKAEFKTLKLADAIQIIFEREPDRLFSVDQMIEELYGPIDDDLMGQSQRRIGVSLGHCLRREEIVRVQDKPAIYRLNA